MARGCIGGFVGWYGACGGMMGAVGEALAPTSDWCCKAWYTVLLSVFCGRSKHFLKPGGLGVVCGFWFLYPTVHFLSSSRWQLNRSFVFFVITLFRTLSGEFFVAILGALTMRPVPFVWKKAKTRRDFCYQKIALIWDGIGREIRGQGGGNAAEMWRMKVRRWTFICSWRNGFWKERF